MIHIAHTTVLIHCKVTIFSAINPLIYIFVGNDFRRRCKTCRRFIEVKIQKYQSRKSTKDFGKSTKSKAKDLKYYDSVISKSDSHHEGTPYFYTSYHVVDVV